MNRFLTLLLIFGIAAPAIAAPAAAAESAAPLTVGTAAPDATARDAVGNATDLGAIVRGKPSVLIFYRGGWCPYCNRHLEALQEVEQPLLDLGYQIIAVSPDKPATLQPAAEKNNLSYRLLSDRGMAAASAYGVAFCVPEDIVEKYGKWNIDLAPVPGDEGKRWLPVPAVFLINDGSVRFVHSDADYKVRIATEDLLTAAKSAR